MPKKTTKKNSDWKEVKKGRIVKNEFAIVTLPKDSEYNYIIYKNGKVLDFFDSLTDAKKKAK